jgi:hypothetical protein
LVPTSKARNTRIAITTPTPLLLVVVVLKHGFVVADNEY